jgi:hypothetical protein
VTYTVQIGEPPLLYGPIAGTAFTAYASFDLAALGYLEEEYFLSGQAQAYEIDGARGSDGRWPVSPAESVGYTTRLVVRRPLDPDWACTHRHIIREGFAWVGVSAQKVGIDGGGIAAGPHLKSVGPDRYKTLRHPGDAFSYDIFSQAGRALRDSRGPRPLGPFLFGTTRPFSAEELAQLYPGGRDSYLKQFGASLGEAVHKGFILEADAEEIRQLAAAAYPK